MATSHEIRKQAEERAALISATTSVHDVAAFILQKRGAMTAMKLQKLVYYSQAWSLVWDDRPLFSEPIEAWANGPVVRELYERHRGAYTVSGWKWGDPGRLDATAIETVEAVLGTYGDKSSQWLSNLTHEEDPWKHAREGLAPTERGESVISLESMCEYYGVLAQNHQR